MKIRFRYFSVLLPLVLIATPLYAVSPKAGGTCSKAGATFTNAGKKYTCVKSGKKLAWNKGEAIPKGLPSPIPTPIWEIEFLSKSVRPTVAILDTALNANLPIFNGRVLYEVCILEWNNCNNGASFDEGTGAARLQEPQISQNGFAHGTQMASIFVKTNPNVNIVFIRIVGINIFGSRAIITEVMIARALDWVIKNKLRFDIQAVTMSQGHHSLSSSTDYCSSYTEVNPKIKELLTIGVPVFFPAGNRGDKNRIDFPACIPEAIAIAGYSLNPDSISSFTNADNALVDFFEVSSSPSILPNGKQVSASGTSVSAQIAAARWLAIKIAKPSLSYSEIYNLLLSTAKDINDGHGVFGKLIDMKAAMAAIDR